MKRPWIFILLAFVLVVYFWVPTLLMVLEDKHEPVPDPISATTKPAVTRRPLDEYSIIAERNLFGTSQKKGSPTSEEMEAILLKRIPVAEKHLGLTLVGTVLGDDPDTSMAFIYSRSTRQQEPYYEGDRIGEVLVKRILRHNVVIETERGEEVLVMSFKGGSGGSSSGDVGLPNSSSFSPKDSSLSSLEGEEDESSLTDLGPTVSSGPRYGSSSGVGDATRDGGNAAVESSGSTSGGGPAATGGSDAAMDSGESLRSSSSFPGNAGSSSSQGEESESSVTDNEPSVSSGPLQ